MIGSGLMRRMHASVYSSRLRVLTEMHPLPLYPAGWEMVFGGRLQYIAFVARGDRGEQ